MSKFFAPSSNWDSHLPLLHLGLKLSVGLVIELGSGLGSTTLLRETCAEAGREFRSFDSDPEWSRKTGSTLVPDWDRSNQWIEHCGLVFIDEAPGEHRKEALRIFKDYSDIIVVHDTERVGAGAYGLEPGLNSFKYRLDFNPFGPGAGASIVSDSVDLYEFEGDYNGFKLERCL